VDEVEDAQEKGDEIENRDENDAAQTVNRQVDERKHDRDTRPPANQKVDDQRDPALTELG